MPNHRVDDMTAHALADEIMGKDFTIPPEDRNALISLGTETLLWIALQLDADPSIPFASILESFQNNTIIFE